MEFELRMISEERCKEIDRWEICDPYGYGKKLSTHGNYWVTNEDESILFCRAFMPRHDDREGNYESFLFIVDEKYNIINYVVEDIKVIDEKKRVFTVNILEKEFINNYSDEVMSILKKVISVFIKKFRREMPGENFEYNFFYKGEVI